MAQLNKETVNKKYSRTWTKINDDGRSDYWRDKFLSIHGGEFTKNGREWVWEDTVEELVQEEPEPIQEGPPPKKIYIVTKPNGEKEEIDNVTQYSKENGLDNGNMYRIVHGKRKSHKGYTIRLKTEGE